MKEDKIEITISSDGSLAAKTKGLKGAECDTELADLLDEIAAIHEVEHTAEAREQPPRRTVVRKTQRRRS
jgi:hypothetical protein